MLEKQLFWKSPHDSHTFWLFAVHGRGMAPHCFRWLANICFSPCAGIIFLDFIFHGWLVAMRKACGYLRKCVSHPAWGSHVGFRCSIGELLRCGSLEISLENTAKHIVRYANWGLPVHTSRVPSWPFSLSFLNTSQGGKKRSTWLTRTWGCRSIVRVYQVDLFFSAFKIIDTRLAHHRNVQIMSRKAHKKGQLGSLELWATTHEFA